MSAPLRPAAAWSLALVLAAWLGLVVAAAWQADAQRLLAFLIAVPAAALVVAAGPIVALPVYFATWFGAGFDLPGLPVSLNRVAAGVLLLAFAVQFLRRPPRRLPSGLAALLAVLTLYAVAGGLWMKAPDAPPSFQQVIYLGVAIMTAMWLETPREMLRLAAILVAITVAFSSIGLLEFLLQRDLFAHLSDHRNAPPDLRINGLSRNAIQFAFNAAWVMPWALVLAVEAQRRPKRLLAAGALLFLMIVSVLTYNRQTPIIVAVMLGAGVLLLRSPWRGWLIAAMAVGVLAVAPLVAQRVAARFADVGALGRPDVSFAIRRDKARIALRVIKASPVVGCGLNNFKDVWWQHREIGSLYVLHTQKEHLHYVDLGYLQIVTETGLMGAGLWLALMTAALWRWLAALRVASAEADTARYHVLLAVGMGLVQLGLSMFLQDTFFTPHTYLLLGLLMAATGAPPEDGRNRHSGEGIGP